MHPFDGRSADSAGAVICGLRYDLAPMRRAGGSRSCADDFSGCADLGRLALDQNEKWDRDPSVGHFMMAAGTNFKFEISDLRVDVEPAPRTKFNSMMGRVIEP